MQPIGKSKQIELYWKSTIKRSFFAKMPFDMAYEIDAYYPITYYLTENGCRGQQIYLSGKIYGEHCGL